MAKFHKTKYGTFVFHCIGCGEVHEVDKRWDFNDDLENPTISPSLLVRYPVRGDEDICHSFIRNGMIQYLSDCTHELAGKTVEIPDFEETHPNWKDL